MGAILGGTMRSPFTGVVFALELTHDVNVLLPLLLAVTVAHGFTVLTLKRSILTEKISRRGYHLSCEYSVDPLEIIFAREVARTSVVALPAGADAAAVAAALRPNTSPRHQQRLYPVVDDAQHLVGVVTRKHLLQWLQESPRNAAVTLADLTDRKPIVAHTDEPLRAIAFRMAERGVTRVPVVRREDGVFAGMLALHDLLTARGRILEAEQRRERIFGTSLRVPSFFGGSKSAA
jgi:CBS domain-containing protein